MNKHGFNGKRTSAALALGLALAATIPQAASAASTASVSIFTPLNTYGGYPNAPLINDGQGNLIGQVWDSVVKGQFSNGSVFSVAPNGTPTTLHAFALDEGYPGAPIVRTSDGSIYGVTEQGGANQTGSVYRIGADGSFIVLHSFAAFTTTHSHQNADGDDPLSLVMGSDGALYGVTLDGGVNNLGTIFRITTDGQFSLLYTFAPLAQSGVDANEPCSLISGADGALYGTTLRNNTQSYGSVFRITTGGQLSIVHTFSDEQSHFCPSLMQAHDGNFYGTVSSSHPGTSYNYSGVVYRLTPDGKTTDLHKFTPLSTSNTNTDGADPIGVIQASDGNLYGVTNGGGSHSAGTLFEISSSGGFKKLYTFPTALNGYPFGFPSANIVQGADGALYGTTAGPRSSTPAIFRAVVSNY
jgi:uncharacterized repeat protein (TIGR03803 family)